MKRIVELDALRGIAAVAILTFHLAPGLLPNGWASVDFFFVLSGYLITTILLRNRDDPHLFYHFYARRSLRIWPIYYLTILAFAGVSLAAPGFFSLRGLPYYLTYTQELWTLWSPGAKLAIPPLEHTWTLAMEEQFYLIWPLLVFLVGPRGVVPLSLGYLALSYSLRTYFNVSGVLLVARGDGFALGGLLAALLNGAGQDALRRWDSRFAAVGVLALGWLALLFGVDGPLATPLGTVVLEPAYGRLILPLCVLFFAVLGLVIGHRGARWLSPLRMPALVYLGTISYGLYLYHIPVMYAAELVFRKFGVHHTFSAERPLYRGALEFGITLAIAALSWRLIEKPILKLKGQFEYRREAHAATASAAGTADAGGPIHGPTPAMAMPRQEPA